MTGHIRRDCRMTRGSECRSLERERAYCVRSCAQAIGRRGADDQNEIVMNKGEAERAAAPSSAVTDKPDKETSPAPPPQEQAPGTNGGVNHTFHTGG